VKYIWLFILFIAFIIAVLFIHDSHIRIEYKILHYFSVFLDPYIYPGGNLSRERFNTAFNTFVSPSKNTNGKFVNGMIVEDIELFSEFEKETQLEKSFKIKIFLHEDSIKKGKNKKLPVLIYIHGGGFVLDFNHKCDINFATEGMIVVSILYRLAPEHIFPTALEDCYSTMVWINERSHNLINEYADLDKLSVIGDSAGGNLASVLTHLMRERNFPRNFSNQILVYPSMNSKEKSDSRLKIGNSAYILPEIKMNWFLDQYIKDEFLYNNPLVNPMKNSDFSKIPDSLVLLAKEDILYSEGKAYADILKSKGINVEVIEFPTVHGFFCLCGFQEEKNSINIIIQYLKKQKFI